jgi:serine/threonine protein kinase
MECCHPLPELARLLDARDEDGPRPVPLESHLDGCPACRRSLLDLAGDLGDRAWGLIRVASGPGDATEGPPAAYLDELKRLLLLDLTTRSTPASGAGLRPNIPGLEVFEEIGRGSMGVVYRARQRDLDREVALKVFPRRRASTPHDSARPLRGAEAIAHLSHPNVVQIFQAGADERFFYGVLEYVDGGSLDRHIGVHWPPGRAAALVETLAGAVQYIHDQGMVHRDLKPGNILLTSSGTPKLADFGLVRRLWETEAEDIAHEGDVVGSPGYMAPEQAEGHGAEVGPASDIYALGAILYELLTGHPPFRGESRSQVLRRVIHASPSPPSRQVPGIPGALEAVCLSCLAKDPRRRPAGGRVLAEALRRSVSNAASQGSPSSNGDDADRARREGS